MALSVLPAAISMVANKEVFYEGVLGKHMNTTLPAEHLADYRLVANTMQCITYTKFCHYAKFSFMNYI